MPYVLEPILFNAFINDIDSENEVTLSKFVHDTMLSGAPDPLKEKDTIQKDFDRLEKWHQKVQQTYVQGPAHGLGQSQVSV